MKYLFESATARCVGHFIPCKLQMQFEQVLFFIRRECDYGERKRKSSVTCRLTSAERNASMLGVLIVCKRDVSRRTIRGRSRCITFFAFCNIKIKLKRMKKNQQFVRSASWLCVAGRLCDDSILYSHYKIFTQKNRFVLYFGFAVRR